jgi:hypothetical protein
MPVLLIILLDTYQKMTQSLIANNIQNSKMLEQSLATARYKRYAYAVISFLAKYESSNYSRICKSRLLKL